MRLCQYIPLDFPPIGALLSERSYQEPYVSHCPIAMHPRTQTTRTNPLGYAVGASRKISDGALARATTTECLDR